MQPLELRLASVPATGGQVVAKPRQFASPVSSPAPESPPPSEIELKQAVAATNAALKQVTNNVEFELDAGTGRTVIRVIDTDTRQVIRQMPSEEMLAIARALDTIKGLLVRQEA